MGVSVARGHNKMKSFSCHAPQIIFPEGASEPLRCL